MPCVYQSGDSDDWFIAPHTTCSICDDVCSAVAFQSGNKNDSQKMNVTLSKFINGILCLKKKLWRSVYCLSFKYWKKLTDFCIHHFPSVFVSTRIVFKNKKSECSLTQFVAQMHKGDDNSRICCPQGAVSDNTQVRVQCLLFSFFISEPALFNSTLGAVNRLNAFRAPSVSMRRKRNCTFALLRDFRINWRTSSGPIKSSTAFKTPRATCAAKKSGASLYIHII